MTSSKVIELLFSNSLSRDVTPYWLRLSESVTTMGYYELITIAITSNEFQRFTKAMRLNIKRK